MRRLFPGNRRYFSGVRKREKLKGSIVQVRLDEEDAKKRRNVKKGRNITVSGKAGSLLEGEYVVCEGEWHSSEKWGDQLKASSITSMLPTSEDATKRYIANFPGIGKKFASRIVSHFKGQQALQVLDNDPAQMLQVPGIGKKKVDSMVEAWKKKKHSFDMTVFLYRCGIGPALAEVIISKHGDNAIELVQENPYALVKKESSGKGGISFEHADKIYYSSSDDAEDDNINRLRAVMCDQVMLLTKSSGHSCVLLDDLLDAAKKKLNKKIGDTRLMDALLSEESLRLDDRITRYHDVDELESWIYPSDLYWAEDSIAKCVRKFSAMRHPLPFINPEALVKWVEINFKLDLAEKQKEAVFAALTNKLLVITGGPGVGKTTTISSIVNIFRHLNLPCVLASPTGRASAKLAEVAQQKAFTLHRLLEFDPASGEFKRCETSKLRGCLFLVDEVSMMDVTLAKAFFEAIPPRSVVIMVGDADQLPSVRPGNFLTDMTASGHVPVIELTEIFRQESVDSKIVQSAHNILKGESPILVPYKFEEENKDENVAEKSKKQKKAEFDSFCAESDMRFVESFGPKQTVEKIKQVVIDLCKRFPVDPVEDIQILTPMKKGILGSHSINSVMQKQMSENKTQKNDIIVKSEAFEYRIGDKVMQIVNDYEKDVFNGEIGKIISLSPTYTRTEMRDIVPSFACTIHKSQGCEFPITILPIDSNLQKQLMQRNLFYTGVTRSMKLCVLVGSEKDMKWAASVKKSSKRNSFLKERIAELF